MIGQQLPEILKKLWAGQDYGATHLNVSGMSSIMMKVPAEDAEAWRGVEVLARMELHLMPTAPVSRMYMEFRDQPDSPFRLDTFYNIDRESDRENVALLARQDELVFHFFAAEDDSYIYSKSINWRNNQRQQVKAMLGRAQRHLAKIQSRFNFDRAKLEVMQGHPL